VRASRELLEELLRLSVTNDVAQVDLYADDAVHELPFSPTGSPIRMTRDQMRAAMTASGQERVTDRNLVYADIFESADAITAVAEYEFAGIVAATGEPLTLTGAMVVTSREGRITRSRNYMDPDVLRRINTPIRWPDATTDRLDRAVRHPTPAGPSGPIRRPSLQLRSLCPTRGSSSSRLFGMNRLSGRR
jgi:uncharacterized protein